MATKKAVEANIAKRKALSEKRKVVDKAKKPNLAQAHTPGPWHVTTYMKKVNPLGRMQRFATIRNSKDIWVVDNIPLDCEFGAADAQLIAIAPELLIESRRNLAILHSCLELVKLFHKDSIHKDILESQIKATTILIARAYGE